MARYRIQISVSNPGRSQKQATLAGCTAADRARSTQAEEYQHRARGIEERSNTLQTVESEEEVIHVVSAVGRKAASLKARG